LWQIGLQLVIRMPGISSSPETPKRNSPCYLRSKARDDFGLDEASPSGLVFPLLPTTGRETVKPGNPILHFGHSKHCSSVIGFIFLVSQAFDIVNRAKHVDILSWPVRGRYRPIKTNVVFLDEASALFRRELRLTFRHEDWYNQSIRKVKSIGILGEHK